MESHLCRISTHFRCISLYDLVVRPPGRERDRDREREREKETERERERERKREKERERIS